ncbi:MAG: hypothetical protein HYZ45_09165, partial [Burkholderiales bacterium]|nr:hypothetical protein [Burkholderiales bacterium]
DILLVEGPPEADGLVELVAHEQMQPPVALLVYAQDNTSQASFYPFARFSPEWQALSFAAQRNIPLRFFDLPLSVRLAQREEEPDSLDIQRAEQDQQAVLEAIARGDPMDQYAKLAGFADGESWWDALIEQRQHGGDLFAVVLEAMRELRANTPALPAKRQIWEDRREAAMRQQIRAAQKEGFQQIAVVCGAWHAPALEHLPPAKHDAALLKDLPKCKVAATWVPWNYQRLSFASGYGAGIASPGWYDFLWQQAAGEGDKGNVGDCFDKLDERWLTHVAHLLRKQDLVASSAEVIDAVRLARMLAVLNGRGQPGLEEFNQAASSVLCMGEAAPLALIRKEMIIGERLGQVPDDTPAAPIARDLAQEQKRLRLKPSALEQPIALYFLNENYLARSHLLHRLALLQVHWGKQQQVRGKKGSFHESWVLLWQPEFAVNLIEAGRYGQTIAAAASGLSLEKIATAQQLPELTTSLQQILLAELPQVLPALLQKLSDLAAQSADILHLLESLPPLLSSLRYGSVRQFDSSQIAAIVTVVLARVAVGLPNACVQIKNEAARELLEHFDALNLALATAQDETLSATWQTCLHSVAALAQGHPLLLGRAHRLLLDAQALEQATLAQRLGLALSHPTPEYSADWVEGLLAGSGLLLLHDETLWALLDSWLRQLRGDEFMRVLPLLRRAFSQFSLGERQMLGQRATQTVVAQASATALDAQRLQQIVPLARRLLGMGT